MWLQVKFKNGQVWAECTADGQLVVSGGRVNIRYQNSAGAKIYRAAAANIEQIAGNVPENGPEPGEVAESHFGKANKRSSAQADKANLHTQNLLKLLPDDTVVCFVDGASRGNPGPAACAYAIRFADKKLEPLAQGIYLGEQTNNYAELMAVKNALDVLVAKQIPATSNVAFLTDSKYVHGLFTCSWQAKANTDLVAVIRQLLKKWPKARFHWVPGHAGVEGNELVDLLANKALDEALSALDK